jgi:starch-binding outer membrane protein, SusD/RagB family
MSINKKITCLFVISALFFAACKKLDRAPIIGQSTPKIYNSAEGAKSVLAKLYSGLSTSGQEVGGKLDIFSNDGGANVYFRNVWISNEVTTDEAILGWADGDLPEYSKVSFTSRNSFVELLYNRLFFQISVCNEFLRQTTDEKQKEFGVPSGDVAAINSYRSEARFLRALAYYHAMDFFGNIPFITEKDQVGIFLPTQKNAADVFTYIESELKAIESELPAPKANEYGRADKAAAWTLLARLYLNAKTYTGTERNADALTYCTNIISSNAYSLPTAASPYTNIFKIDNKNTNEIIFPLLSDGNVARSYGNSTFLVHAAIVGTMDFKEFGVNGGWSGLRAKENLVNLFTNPADKRGNFFTTGQSKSIAVIATQTDGYGLKKFYNISSTGDSGVNNNFVDLDFPLFRYADVLLMYAEAHLRGGGGNAGDALNYINALRARAYGNATGNIAAGDLTLAFILDERARELHWEGYRRTDLIRFNKYTSGYNWPFKGGVAAGQDIDARYKLFPIPSTDLSVNPNLVQNPGY